MAPRLMLVIAAAGLTEADLSSPLWGLVWIVILLLVNMVRTLGDPFGTF